MAPGKGNDEHEPFHVEVNGEYRHGKKEDLEDDDTKCGIGLCKPKPLQVFANMGAFVGIYSISGLMTSTLSMYIISQITTLEKQFGFSSAQTGFLMSCNDIGFLLTILLVSYMANKVHIPRFLWLSTMMYGISGLICSIVYFVSKDFFKPPEDVSKLNASFPSLLLGSAQTCVFDNGNATAGMNDTLFCDASKAFGIGLPNKYSRLAMGLIALGMLLQGMGKSPRYPMVVTYIDGGDKMKTPMFVGISVGVAIFGPAIAFSVGGVFSKIYLTLEDVNITPMHPAWIGAWWLGFVIFGGISILTSFPLLLFPRRMKGSTNRTRTKRKPKFEDSGGATKVTKDFFKAVLRLISNPVYFGLVLCNCVILLYVSGSVAFSPKYLELQFFLPSWKANMYIGALSVASASVGTIAVGVVTTKMRLSPMACALSVASASVGTIAGGVVTTKMRLSPMACLKLSIVLSILSTAILCLQYVLGCSNPELAGFNVQSSRTISTEFQNITLPCGTTCGCDDSDYFPVCGSDGINYFSPCHGGCTGQSRRGFADCSCIGTNATATPGLCPTGCNMLFPYLGGTFVASFLATFGMMPVFIVYLRSVKEKDKGLAIGLSAFLTTLLGWFPGAVIYGKIVDTTCLVWKTSCAGTGSCSLYDIDDLRVKKTTYEVCVRIVSLFIFGFVLYKARTKTDWSVDPDARQTTAEGEAMIAYDDADMAKTPTDWKSEPIFIRDSSKKL